MFFVFEERIEPFTEKNQLFTDNFSLFILKFINWL